MTKKRHHYVPITYLNSFCDERGQLSVYLKSDPDRVVRQSPKNVAFHKYYYSQPLPGGGKEHDALEDFFSRLESKWPSIVQKLHRKESIDDHLKDLFAFMALQRARVPASRDMSEKMLAEAVEATTRAMDEAGKFPPKPEGFENILDLLEVSIDPHMSIHAMTHVIRGIAENIFMKIGFGAFHNATDLPFLTSDNPVIWFDPSVAESEMRPYAVRPDGPILFLFPVSSTLIIYGDTSVRQQYLSEGFRYGDLSNREMVETINRQICRYAYRSVFAQDQGQEALIREHANASPVLHTERVRIDGREFLIHQSVFGEIPRKPKWRK